MISLSTFVSSRRSTGTRDQYRHSLCLFFECLSGVERVGRNRSPEHIAHMDQLSITYLSGPQDYVSDLIHFVTYLDKYSQNSKTLHLSTTILWLELNDVTLKRAQIDFIKSGAGKRRTETEGHILTHEEIKRWYESLSRLGRVVLLVQLSSGMRLGEVLGLEPGDVDLDKGIVWVRRSGPKTKIPKNQKQRITFLTEEALYSVREWLTYRDTWVDQACRKFNGRTKKNMVDTRIFPASHNTIQEAYTRGLKKIGLYERDENTDRATVTSHSVRKYFNSQLKMGMPDALVEKLIGHAGYMGGIYDQWNVEQLKSEYDKYSYLVSIFASENVPVIKAELVNQQENIRSLVSENIKMRTELEDLSKFVRAVQASGKLDP